MGFALSGALRQGAARDGGLVGSSSGVHEQRQGADGGPMDKAQHFLRDFTNNAREINIRSVNR